MSNTFMNLIRYGQMNPALSPEQQAVINDPYTQAAASQLAAAALTQGPKDHSDPYMVPALTQPTNQMASTPRLEIGDVPLREGAQTDQQRKMLPFSLTKPTPPNNKIGLYEGAIRVGGEMLKGSQLGGLNAMGAGANMYGKIEDYNRAQEMQQYKTEIDSYNKGLKALMDAQKGKKGNEAPQQSPYAAVTLNAIDTVFEQVTAKDYPFWPFDNTTGLIGNLMTYLPGSPAHDVAANVETIVSSIGFDRLQKMRDDSPTGGALGQVSERELSQLNASLGNLRQSQSKGQFLRNLQIVRQHYISTVEAIYNQQVEYARRHGLQTPERPDVLQQDTGIEPQLQADIDKYANM